MPNTLKHPQVKTKKPVHANAAPRMPHERDESEDSQSSEVREDIQQAYNDVEQGLVDTGWQGAIHANQNIRASHETTQATPPHSGRNRDRNRLKLPDGK